MAQIYLGKGIYTEVDDQDVLWLSLMKSWHCGINGVYSKHNRKTVYMHRLIYERMYRIALKEGELIDHEDRDNKNNKRTNLRLANKSLNAANRTKTKANTSGFKGVFKKRNKWKAQIRVDRKSINLGSFFTKEEASKAYMNAAKKYFGDFASQ